MARPGPVHLHNPGHKIGQLNFCSLFDDLNFYPTINLALFQDQVIGEAFKDKFVLVLPIELIVYNWFNLGTPAGI